MPLPIPELAPVTMATRSFSLNWTLLSTLVLRHRRQSNRRVAGCQSAIRCSLFLITIAVCTQFSPTQASVVEDNLRAVIEGNRALKDSLFRHGDDSPLRLQDKSDFDGLRYFPVNLGWRVEGELHRYGRTRQIQLPDTGGSSIAVERFGRFLFQVDRKAFWLEVFRSVQGGSLTTYFTDQTNGTSTYGAGRYAVVGKSDDGTYVLDFNGSYSPYCAYNEDYVCPLPPAHNHLPFKVDAGELDTGPDLAH
ncbi:MAG TPA: DUF1684 domain-containing protein [Candidatus Handelsmanbacteria bacterium]|nr:DUF1684 domain-containing protein [Candidatus Handelsmanbacteria bacterium]